MDESRSKTALVIGAGPAGLTAALELLRHTAIKPLVLEMSDSLGGLSCTHVYKGNRIDLGGHRFFSKSDRIMAWWQEILPLATPKDLNLRALEISYQNTSRRPLIPDEQHDPELDEHVMLVRERLSRIYFRRKLFNYPISFNLNTLVNLGPWPVIRVCLSYFRAMAFQIKPERHLEDFFINRFGRELYRTFFRDYTEKVWGVKCTEISPEWGRQRIKELSIAKTVLHAFKSFLSHRRGGIDQKRIETSLIQRFLYPKYGPGHMWERVAGMVRDQGGQVLTRQNVTALHWVDGAIARAEVQDLDSGQKRQVEADYFISTMPLRELIAGIQGVPVPDHVRDVANGLQYRDFITVGLLLNRLKLKDPKNPRALIADTWIYIQEPEVKVGRLQIYNNWSPYMVVDPEKVWIGMEYFCNEGEGLWSMNDQDVAVFAMKELASIDIIELTQVVDHVVVRAAKAYPGYFGSYARLCEVRAFLDPIPNLFLVGRNGMHRYNNQDHSMLTAIEAVATLAKGRKGKDHLWAINTEQAYQE